MFLFQFDRNFNRQQAKERREFDDRVHGDGRCVLERIADRVAYYGGSVERRAFLFQIHFHDFFGVVPRAAGVGHENRLE